MWLLPTRNRIGNVRRMLRGFREFGISTPGIILVNADEFNFRKNDYATLDLPPGWTVMAVEADCMQGALRAAWPLVSSLKWVGLLQDDLIPGVPGWDTALVNKLNGWNVVSAYDGRTPRMHGAIVWSGDLARDLGGLYPGGFKHLYGDDVWETLGRETGCWHLEMSVITPHQNETYGGNADETALSIASHTDHDKARYEEWVAKEKVDCVERIKALKAAKGARDIQVDFSGMSILIATPSVSHRPEGSYMQSLSETMRNLAQVGVNCAWSVEKYNADISLARSKLFSMFLRSPFSHMLMIDDDMDWDFAAVMRLIAAKKDFVAVAGPKKSYPPRFAANHTDDFENVLPLQWDKDSGTCEVTEVGAAFCLISKVAALKFSQSYPELECVGAGGEVDYGAFIPMIYRKRYKAEDFAFCRRLKAIGVSIHICPDVPLGHTGAHRFYGSLFGAHQQYSEAMQKGAAVPSVPFSQAAE